MYFVIGPLSWCWYAALVLPERVRPERVRGHARPALPVGRVLRVVAHPRRYRAHVELQLRRGFRSREGPVLLLRSAQL